MRTICDSEKKELAVIYGVMDYNDTDKSQFLTNTDESLQAGSLYFHQNAIVEPHIHRIKNGLTLYPIVELLVILHGEAVIDFYDEAKSFIVSAKVVTGDIILLKRGGHGLSFPDSSVRLLDIRPGNYIDKKTDKEMIR